MKFTGADLITAILLVGAFAVRLTGGDGLMETIILAVAVSYLGLDIVAHRKKK